MIKYVALDKLIQIINSQKESIQYQYLLGFGTSTKDILKVLDDIITLANEESDEVNNERGDNHTVLNCQSKGERIVADALLRMGYTPHHNVIKEDCRGNVNPLPFDFGILVQGKEVLIEYDGIQHKKPIHFFGGVKKFAQTQKYDDIKNSYCKSKGIPLLRISENSDIDSELSTFIQNVKRGKT